jgi:hypothetical protein
MNLWDLWKLVEADLIKARNTLPESAASNRLVSDYQSFIENNELELACDMLEAYADEFPVNQEFWLALRDAAVKMELAEHAQRYGRRAAAG